MIKLLVMYLNSFLSPGVTSAVEQSMIASESGGSEDVDSSIKAQLEDEVIREALTSGTDLRQYSQSVEKELRQVGPIMSLVMRRFLVRFLL